MRGFGGILSEPEIAALASFVLEEFARCRRENTRYHTAANGWPDHRARYRAAYPYVLGAAEVATTNEGFTLFREACIACHDPRRPLDPVAMPAASAGQDGGIRILSAAAADEPRAHDDHDEDEEDYEEGDDDGSPAIANLSPVERAGLDLYRSACAYCHGLDGTGRNSIAVFLEPRPTDFTEPGTARRLQTGDLRASIMRGLEGTSMPAFRAALTEGEIDAVIAYMRRAFFSPSASSAD